MARRNTPAAVYGRIGLALAFGLISAPAAWAGKSGPGRSDGWIELTADEHMNAWKKPTGEWEVVADVKVNPKNPRLLVGETGKEGGARAIYNGPTGRTRNLLTKESFGDVEIELEFILPKGSNSGIKLMGLYEVQFLDSFGVEKPKASDCGGIYPRAELLPTYHYLDKGHPPKVNACLPAGEWQTLKIVFHAPKFDAPGKKTANARFDKVELNGKVVQQDLDVETPTGHAWHEKEIPNGPILLQADHGPVGFRNLKVRPLRTQEK